MPKYAITMWQTAKYQVIFDADNLQDAKAFLNGKTTVNELQECEVIFIKGTEDIDPLSIEEVPENKTKESNNE